MKTPPIGYATLFIGVLMAVFFFLVLGFIGWARRGGKLWIRRISGIDAIDDAIGRAVELGRPLAFTTGLASVGPLLFAVLGVIAHLARRVARYASRLFIAQNDPEVMLLVEQTLREGYRAEGKIDQFHPEMIRFLSGSQFAFAAGYMGMVHREQAASCFLFGSFAAESLILAEAGQQVGAVQVAATVDYAQIPFFLTTCDYTLIGEETYAAGAYLSRDPVQLGSLRAQDVGKLIVFLLLALGVASASWSTWAGPPPYVPGLTPDGKVAVLASSDHTVRVWDLERGTVLGLFKGHTGPVRCGALSPDGRTAATGGEDQAAMIWEVATGSRRGVLRGHTGAVCGAAFSPDGKRLATTSADRTARIWEVNTCKIVRNLEGHRGEVNGAAWSPDGARVVTAGADHTARIWNAATGELLITLEGHTGEVTSVAWSPDGKKLLTASRDRTARLWEAATGAEVRQYRHEAAVKAAAWWTPDGRLVLTAAEDKTLRLLPVVGSPGEELRLEVETLCAAAFAEGGRALIAGDDYTAQLWTVTGDPPRAWRQRQLSAETAPRSVRRQVVGHQVGLGRWLVPFTLTVEKGSGSGHHVPGQEVRIRAEEPRPGQVFARWVGEVATVQEVTQPETTLVMPESSVKVAATYQDRPPSPARQK